MMAEEKEKEEEWCSGGWEMDAGKGEEEVILFAKDRLQLVDEESKIGEVEILTERHIERVELDVKKNNKVSVHGILSKRWRRREEGQRKLRGNRAAIYFYY
ncbi:hypothetical protein TWF694_004926 [Orbilia ellipsospora]|uniref:Uncharacterized protein n=1 Tax=Orbilia ellipsospora TaxID=2528407 RepID=A0AAV9WV36_9PEZI